MAFKMMPLARNIIRLSILGCFSAPLFFTPTVAGAMTASRTSGVAPLGVSFSAEAEATTSASKPFHDRLYVWDFGDANGDVWALSGKSKNAAQGPVTAHVFEEPGTYTVTLTVSDSTGAVFAEAMDITVEDPDTVYSGTDTRCFCDSASSDFSGCPEGALQTVTDDLSDIKSAVASGKRILLHRGSSWNSTGLDSDERSIGQQIEGPVTFGAYGERVNPDDRGICENAPVIQLDYPLSDNYYTVFGLKGASDWRIMDISLNATEDYYAAASGSTDIGPCLLLRMKTTGFSLPIAISSYQTAGHDQVMILDSDFSDTGTHAVYAGSENLVLMGNEFRDAGASHVVRIWQAYNGTISHNSFSGASLDNSNGRHALKLHGMREDILDTEWGTWERTRFVVLADNVFGGSGPWTIAIGPQNAEYDERLSDIIVENNRFFADYGNLSTELANSPLYVWASDISIRNNIFDGNGSDTSFKAITVEQRGVEPAPSGVHIFNNTIFKNDVAEPASEYNFFAGIQVENLGEDVNIMNNLVLFPEDDYADLVTVIRNKDDSVLTEGGNLLIQGTTIHGLADPCLEDHLERDYRLVRYSTAIDAGVYVPVFSDYGGNVRPENESHDAGAFEYYRLD